jgi:hypothetical protein
MMKKEWILPLICVTLPILLALPFGCASDELPKPSLDFCDSLGLTTLTYDNDIEPIVVTKCANTDNGTCHSSGSADGDYTDYQGMLLDLENGRINEEVIIDRTMPQIGSEELTDEEMDMFQCWLGNGFPEN